MTQPLPWPAEMTRATGRQVRRYRTDAWRSNRMSAEQLAAVVTGLGLPYTRAQVTNLEAGRRTSITLGEVLVLAAALEVPPVLLVFPVGVEGSTEFLPGRTGDTWSSVQWFAGEQPPPDWQASSSGETVVGGWPQRLNRNALPLHLYRRHDQLVVEWRRYNDFGETERDEQNRLGREGFLAETREQMREAEILPPPLPPELAHVDAKVDT